MAVKSICQDHSGPWLVKMFKRFRKPSFLLQVWAPIPWLTVFATEDTYENAPIYPGTKLERTIEGLYFTMCSCGCLPL